MPCEIRSRNSCLDPSSSSFRISGLSIFTFSSRLRKRCLMQGFYWDSKEKSSRKLPRFSESLLSSSPRSGISSWAQKNSTPKTSPNIFCYRLSFTRLKNLDLAVDLYFLLFHSESSISFFHQPLKPISLSFCFLLLSSIFFQLKNLMVVNVTSCFKLLGKKTTSLAEDSVFGYAAFNPFVFAMSIV